MAFSSELVDQTSDAFRNHNEYALKSRGMGREQGLIRKRGPGRHRAQSR
jgi:hypothetical protein